MKQIFFFTAMAFLTLSSCRKEGTTLSKDQTLAQSQSQTNARNSSTAIPFHGSFDENLDGIQLYNLCTNELMTLYGSAHDFFMAFTIALIQRQLFIII